MLTNTSYRHVIVNDSDELVIEDTNFILVELVLNHTAYGWEPAELQENHPYLTLSQIYSALAYYWDHQNEVDADIHRRLERVDLIQKRHSRPTSTNGHTTTSSSRAKCSSGGMSGSAIWLAAATVFTANAASAGCNGHGR